MKNDFYYKVRARGGTPDSEQRLRKQIRRLKELRAADAEEIAQLKADVEALVGALHQTTVENGRLRHQLADRASVARTLPAQAPFPLAARCKPVHQVPSTRQPFHQGAGRTESEVFAAPGAIPYARTPRILLLS